MKFNEDLIKKIKNNINDYIVEYRYNNKSYIIKRNNNDFLQEKLGESVAELLNIEHAKYYRYENSLEDIDVIISENLHDKGEFIEFYELLKDSKKYNENKFDDAKFSLSLYEIWDILEDTYNNTEQLMKDVIKVYIMDMIMLNFDRHYCNWGILTQDGKNKIAIFDNGHFLNPESRNVIHSYFNETERTKAEKEDEIDTLYDFDNMKYISVSINDIKKFVKESSEEFIEELETIISKLNNKYIEKEIEKLEKEYNDKISYKENVLLSNFIINGISEAIENNKDKIDNQR